MPRWLRVVKAGLGHVEGHLGAKLGPCHPGVWLGPWGAMLGTCSGLVAAQKGQNPCKTQTVTARLEAKRQHAEILEGQLGF